MQPRSWKTGLLRRGESGAAMTEFAILLPIFVMLVMWSNYLWDIGRARIKSLEIAQFVAWEQVGYAGAFKNPAQIASEAKSRYADLDGTTPGGTAASSRLQKNDVVVETSLSVGDSMTAASPGFSNGISGGIGSVVSSAIGTAIRPLAESLVGGARIDTLATSQVTLKVTNNTVAKEYFSDYLTRPLEFKASSTVLYDSWAAWRPGDSPMGARATVRRRLTEALRNSNGKVAYPVVGSIVGEGSFLGTALGVVVGLLGMPRPLLIKDEYVQVDNRSLAAEITGTNAVSTAMPGRLQENAWWQGNGTEWSGARGYSSLAGLNNGAGYWDWNRNYYTRAANCRGPYWEGSTQPQQFFYRYNIDATNACIENTGSGSGVMSMPYTTAERGTRKGLKHTGGFILEFQNDLEE